MNEDWKALERAADNILIQMLQGRYMFYLDEFRYDKILEKLVAGDHPEVSFEIEDSGCFEGPEQVKRFLLGLHEMEKVPIFGIMPTLTLATPVIVFSRDGKRAKGYWHYFGANSLEGVVYPDGDEELIAMWAAGKFENEYIEIEGEWKLLKLRQIKWMRTDYDQGWVKQSDCARFKVPEGCIPDKPSRNLSYRPDCIYTLDGSNNWGPFPPLDESF